MESRFPTTHSGGMILVARLIDRRQRTVAHCATLATNRDTADDVVHLAESE
jgi:hypothetical protein